MKASTGLIIFVVLVAIVVGLIVINTGDDEDGDNVTTTTQTETNNGSSTEEQTTTTETDTFTVAEVATHSSASDCWTIIDGNVYDITEYIPRHPGGDEILRACGADGSTLFNERTTEDGDRVGSGTPHSSSAASILASFQVGELAN